MAALNQAIPAIASSAYATSVYDAARLMAGDPPIRDAQFDAKLNKLLFVANAQQIGTPIDSFQQEPAAMANRRLVKVVIIDPNDNVPLTDCVLYSGEEKLTDATDQELFFEIDIKNILETHNAKRVKLLDKKVKERSEYLEPAKIRDLKMVVVNVATF